MLNDPRIWGTHLKRREVVMGPEELWTEDIHLYEVVWTCGPVDLWTEDIHLYDIVWTCGPVDLWTRDIHLY